MELAQVPSIVGYAKIRGTVPREGWISYLITRNFVGSSMEV
jgi:hypothetical protein